MSPTTRRPRPSPGWMMMAGVWIGAAAIATFVRPDLRGPLAAIVDLDLAGHTAEARQRFSEVEALIRDADLDPSDLRPPTSDELLRWPRPADPPHEAGDRQDMERLAELLTDQGRDDAARAYYRILFHARHGRMEAAREESAILISRRDTPRARALEEALATKEQP